MKRIRLNTGAVALVDDQDYSLVSEYAWQLHVGGYAYCIKQKDYQREAIYMHRLILGAKPGQYTDHANHNKLDNRRNNIRLCTQSQNLYNQRGQRLTSKYKGVSWDRSRKLWTSHIGHNHKQKNLGRFQTEHEAAQVYNAAALSYHGEFALLNEV